ncbi:MAG: hypothetical protein ACUVRV_06050 [Cyanobacteriota bacterium]
MRTVSVAREIEYIELKHSDESKTIGARKVIDGIFGQRAGSVGTWNWLWGSL